MTMDSSETIKIYDWHPYKSLSIRLMALAGFAGGAVSLVFWAATDMPKILSIGLSAGFFVSGMALLCRCKTVIDLSNRTVTRDTALLDRFRLYQRRFPFKEFSAIELGGHAGGDRDNCFVGLRRASGGKLWITYFENPPDGISRQAEEFAARLSSDFQLPINRVR